MKKIMFNDKYKLTDAVLSGRKTHTRRIIPDSFFSLNWDVREDEHTLVVENDFGDFIDIRHTGFAKYEVGEVVAVAQSYKTVTTRHDCVSEKEIHDWVNRSGVLMGLKSWTNKMFVRADLMPHQIRITNVRVERLQDISDKDCIKEGILYLPELRRYYFEGGGGEFGFYFNTPREAYAALIDKISGKGTWDRNPYVFSYEFELIK